jgi:hypothetical protein
MIPRMQMRALRTRLAVIYNLVPYTMCFCEAPSAYEHERCLGYALQLRPQLLHRHWTRRLIGRLCGVPCAVRIRPFPPLLRYLRLFRGLRRL